MIKCVARSSNLSKAQVKEIQMSMGIPLEGHYIASMGDLDLKTSLIDESPADFFTREIDEAVLRGEARIAIHSAKDLPGSLKEGLVIAALTESVHEGDCLVMRPHETLESLPLHARIGGSSLRRKETIQRLRKDFVFCDIRGTIEQRIALIEGPLHGVIIAKAALIRLQLLHLNLIDIPGKGAENQGRLAVVCRNNDFEMIELFKRIDGRKRLESSS